MPHGIILNIFRCGHCKKLEPTYAEVANELAAQGSPSK